MQCNDKRAAKKDIGKLLYTDLYPNGKEAEEVTKEFLNRLLGLMLDFLKSCHDRNGKVLDFHQPEELQKMLDLEIPDDPLPLEQLLVDCNDAMKYQVKTAHPHFFNQLSCGIDIISMVGEYITATTNTNMFTYEIAPVFILMEEITMKKMREVIGWPNGDGDSILAPGGSISNLYAMMAARHKMFPTYKNSGLKPLPQLVMFTSEHSHYSLKGAGMTGGLGMDNVIEVPCDSRGRMLPEELEKLVQRELAKGHKPFFVCCTCGTTVLGAFDPIHPLADICDKYGMWLHIDAAWGGGCLLSRKHRHKMDGVERAQSVTWNPHKLMSATLQCSTIHFREDGLLISCNQLCADYLFQQDKHYNVNFDTGDKVIQCGRHNDVFKLWLMWRAKGVSGYERHIDHLFEMTDYMVQRIKEKKDRYHLLLEPECTNVSFRYVPSKLRSMPNGKEKDALLGILTARIKGEMMNKGTLMVGYQPLGEIPNFFRSIISSAAVQKEDVDFLLDEIERIGESLPIPT